MAATQTSSGQVGTTWHALGDFVPYREGNVLGRTGFASSYGADLAPALYGKQNPKAPMSLSRQPQLWFSCLAGICNSKEPITGSEHPSVQAELARLGQEARTCSSPSPPARAWTSFPAHTQESRSELLTEKQTVSPVEPPARALRCQQQTGTPCSARGPEVNPHPGPALCAAPTAPFFP